MNSLNAMWFYKMLRGALRVLSGSKHKGKLAASDTELSDR